MQKLHENEKVEEMTENQHFNFTVNEDNDIFNIHKLVNDQGSTTNITAI